METSGATVTKDSLHFVGAEHAVLSRLAAWSRGAFSIDLFGNSKKQEPKPTLSEENGLFPREKRDSFGYQREFFTISEKV